MDLSNRRVLVYDTGLFTGLAWHLSRHFGEVMYFSPWQRSYPTVMDVLIGEGYRPYIRRVRDFWREYKKADLIVFPDCLNDDLQEHLEETGSRVWGSRSGVSLEMDRWKTKQFLKEVGLPVQPCEQVEGLDNLRSLLKDKERCFVKISRWRGDMESWEHISMDLSGPRLDELAFRFGPFKNKIKFIVEDEIRTKIEVGYDGPSIDGEFPEVAMQGYEEKDHGLLAAVMPYRELPEEVREVNAKVAPFLKRCRYRNFFSTEIRIGEDGLPYPIDFTCRQPSPSGEIQCAIYKNLGELMWEGAAGNLVTPDCVAQYAAEAMIYSDWAHEHWTTIEVKTEAQPFVTFFNSSNINDTVEAVRFPSQNIASLTNEIGAVVGFGGSPKEAVDQLKHNSKMVTGMGIDIRIGALSKLLGDIKSAEEIGMKFSDQAMPSVEDFIS